ncbi:hypothetical protein DMENIID0001_007480 [Sergentomyia squamirostris]
MAAKTNQQRRRPPNNKGNNFKQQNKFKPGVQKRMMRPNLGAMFNSNYNANQMMDNPGYMDFNEPAVRPPPMGGGGGGNNMGNMPNKQQNKPGAMVQRKQNNNRQMMGNQQNNRRRQQTPQQRSQPGGGGMGGMSGGNMGGGGWGNQQSRMPQIPPNMNQRPGPFRGRPMPPRMPPHPMPSMPPFHPPPMNGRFMGFGPRPIPSGPPMPPPMGHQWPPMPRPPPPGAMGPPRPLMGGPRNVGNVGGNRMRRQQNNNKTQRKPTKNAKGKVKLNAKKPNNQPQNQYPLDEPWVTQEIRDQHQKKQDLQNQLKGNRNDELFALFKSERDKFVSLYDAAKAEFNKNKNSQEKNVESDNANGKNAESKPNGE